MRKDTGLEFAHPIYECFFCHQRIVATTRAYQRTRRSNTDRVCEPRPLTIRVYPVQVAMKQDHSTWRNQSLRFHNPALLRSVVMSCRTLMETVVRESGGVLNGIQRIQWELFRGECDIDARRCIKIPTAGFDTVLCRTWTCTRRSLTAGSIYIQCYAVLPTASAHPPHAASWQRYSTSRE